MPDYDWFRWQIATSGTFSALTQATNGNIELHLFTLNPNGTLLELARSTNPGPTTRGVSHSVTAGQTIFVEVKGLPLALGLFGQATYDLTVQLA